MSFIKTTWFKCIACLLCIAVISGASLAILNNVLYVSPETRTARAISKIYGEEKLYFFFAENVFFLNFVVAKNKTQF